MLLKLVSQFNLIKSFSFLRLYSPTAKLARPFFEMRIKHKVKLKKLHVP